MFGIIYGSYSQSKRAKNLWNREYNNYLIFHIILREISMRYEKDKKKRIYNAYNFFLQIFSRKRQIRYEKSPERMPENNTNTINIASSTVSEKRDRYGCQRDGQRPGSE